ncbi:uncharacterized protein EDB91DRAFT_1340880 [Suillus paluster]|uniref:uncharacterized protein n=1 Tax=Suillus paluster TaxID=48578 RepID=UPI001B86EF02|nr:uncharacterized protein EDB91DRAFT_1340880 [Suillus paluster]KAG1719543.1 hypothetical protein EDB91DRAFT_1340880 [Suillus paluster]
MPQVPLVVPMSPRQFISVWMTVNFPSLGCYTSNSSWICVTVTTLRIPKIPRVLKILKIGRRH